MNIARLALGALLATLIFALIVRAIMRGRSRRRETTEVEMIANAARHDNLHDSGRNATKAEAMAEDSANRAHGSTTGSQVPARQPAARMRGDVQIGGAAVFPGGLAVHGKLVLEDGCELRCPIEVHGDARLGANASITEPLIVHGDLTLAKGAAVGPARVHGVVVLGPDAVVNGPLECDALHFDEVAPRGKDAPAPKRTDMTPMSGAVDSAPHDGEFSDNGIPASVAK